MKADLLIMLLAIFLFSCGDNKEKKVLSDKEMNEENARIELSDYSEKIVLLAAIKNISYDSLKFILTDYYAITSDFDNSSDSSKFYSDKAINDISTKYRLPKSKVASLIFSFKYEMLTREEVTEQEKEKNEDKQPDVQENPK